MKHYRGKYLRVKYSKNWIGVIWLAHWVGFSRELKLELLRPQEFLNVL